MHTIHEYRVSLIMGRLGWVYLGPMGLGNGLHVLGNGPSVLGNGPLLYNQFMKRVILIMGRIEWVVCLSWP